jgi:hypothetical protein
METIMSKTNETFGDHDTLADSELDAVAGAAKSNDLAARENALLAAILQAAAHMLPRNP